MLTKVGRAAALPNYGWPQRFSTRAIPRENCLALIGNSDRGESVGRDLLEAAIDDGLDRLPNGEGILLDPARTRKGDFHWERGLGHDLALAIDDDCLGIRRSLINC